MIMAASEIGVAALDPVDEAIFHEEIERAINGDRRWPRHRFGELVDYFVSAERTMGRQQRLQHLATNRREFPRPALANPLGMINRVRSAAAVIVIGRRKGRFCQGHQIMAIKAVVLHGVGGQVEIRLVWWI